jgi:hypothetical protein
MLRMRLSLDCGYAAVATQGVSDNLFTVRIARRANKGPITLKRKRGTGALTDQVFQPKFASPFQKLWNVFREGD